MSVMEQFIFNEEMAPSGAPRGGNFGIGTGWAGPTLIVLRHRGAEAEVPAGHPPGRRRLVPGLQRARRRLRPRVAADARRRDGDDYVVNGQKIWTSGAHLAKYMILLARTDPDAPKHRGISYFILDMKTPGITVRPLVNMAGNHDFNEVFFDDVRVPTENLIGEENRGWYVGTTTLDFERSRHRDERRRTRCMVRGPRRRSCARTSDDGRHLRRSAGCRNELADRAIEAEVEEMLSYAGDLDAEPRPRPEQGVVDREAVLVGAGRAHLARRR